MIITEPTAYEIVNVDGIESIPDEEKLFPLLSVDISAIVDIVLISTSKGEIFCILFQIIFN